MMLKHLPSILLLLILFLQGCSGNYEKNMSKLDEIYGECDNPANSARYKYGSKGGKLAKQEKELKVRNSLILVAKLTNFLEMEIKMF